MTLSRRALIAHGAAAAGAGWALAGCSAGADPRPRQTDLLRHAPLNHAVLAAFDLGGSDQRPVADAVRRLAERVDGALPGAQVMVGLGASLFDRAGRADRRPRQLTAMPSFPGDVLDPARCHGDLLVEASASTAAEAARVLRDVAGDLPPRWRMDGFRDGSRVEGGRAVATNLFGFTEGHGNPAPPGIDDVVRVGDGQGEPGWATGGSYQVVRIIQFATALWDKDPVEDQEKIIGRRRDGRWLDGTAAHGDPAFPADPRGQRTPLDSHVRRANPRTGPPPPLLRRGYSFQGGTDGIGRGESGLLFVSYQRDLAAGFEAVQRRLAGEKLGRYALTVGGGYFFVPPPTVGGSSWGGGIFSA